MAAPIKSLLLRSVEGSFRPRHHFRLLASDPDLPVARLAELQQRARASSDEQEQQALGREFAARLRRLGEDDRRLLAAGHDTAEATGAATTAESESGPVSEPVLPPSAGAEERGNGAGWLEEVGLALEELVGRARRPLHAAERFRAKALTAAVELLVAVDAELVQDRLTVEGSTGQRRPHPLIPVKMALLRELPDRLQRLEFMTEQRAMMERMNALQKKRWAQTPQPSEVIGDDGKLTPEMLAFLHRSDNPVRPEDVLYDEDQHDNPDTAEPPDDPND